MIERLHIRNKLYWILQTEYVALLGQRSTGIETLVKSLMREKPLISGMQFISVALPEGINEDRDFKEIFLKRLIKSADRVLPDNIFTDDIRREIEHQEQYSVDFRLRVTLETLGGKTSAKYLVIILHAFKKISTEPMKNLLLMLRDCHNQIDTPGEACEKLRFLVAGYLRLWHLCCRKTPDLSPFNIAERVFLEGVSEEEIQQSYKHVTLDVAGEIKNLTDGVPLLVEQVINWPKQFEDLVSAFRILQNNWNSLPDVSKEILKRVVEGREKFPECQADYGCPQIPEIDSPLLEAFWGGFLKMDARKLTWRSLIHRAFVEERANLKGDSAKQALRKIEKISLTISQEDTLQAINSESTLRELSEELKTHKELTDTSTSYPDSETIRDREFDVFLAHNSADKPQVEAIGEALKCRGLKPWIDKEQIPPGRWFQDVIQQAITNVKTAAIIIGVKGLGKWQALELRSFISQCVDCNIPVIPVLLPDVNELPSELLFLKELNWVSFKESIDEPEVLDNLQWGITGEHPQRITK